MTNLLTIAEAAELAGVTPVVLHRAVRAGELHAVPYGDVHTLSYPEVHRFMALPRTTGRPYGEARAWQALRDLDRGDTPAVDPRQLLGKLRRRARRTAVFVHPGMLSRLADRAPLVSGHGVLRELIPELAGGEERLDIYGTEAEMARAFDEAHATRATHEPNVIGHVVEVVSLPPTPPAPLALLDLSESVEARVRGIALERWDALWS